MGYSGLIMSTAAAANAMPTLPAAQLVPMCGGGGGGGLMPMASTSASAAASTGGGRDEEFGGFGEAEAAVQSEVEEKLYQGGVNVTRTDFSQVLTSQHPASLIRAHLPAYNLPLQAEIDSIAKTVGGGNTLRAILVHRAASKNWHNRRASRSRHQLAVINSQSSTRVINSQQLGAAAAAETKAHRRSGSGRQVKNT